MAQAARRGIDRRTLLRMAAVAGVTVAIRPLDAFAQAFSGNVGAQPIGGPAWQSAPGVARQRIEGFAKVSGAKIYAADFRAADMPGWPATTGHALLVKTTDATHVFEGIDLDLLTPEFRPDRVVLAADLASAGITVPGLLCRRPARARPARPRSISASRWRSSSGTISPASRSAGASSPPRPGFVKMGAETGAIEQDPYGAFHFVRVAGPTPDSG